MAKVIAITEAFKTLAEVETRLGLSRSEDTTFFSEWRAPLPSLSAVESDRLEVMRQRLLYHRADGDLLEGSVMLLVASPLLELAGFYDPPFKLKAEAAVEVVVDDGEEVLRGRIDALILQQSGQQTFWVLVLEAKKTTISTRSALPQALAYMMANTQPGLPTFGLLTNGDDVLFVKLATQPINQYSLSRVFSLYTLPEELQVALQILKRIGGAITAPDQAG
ncbi:type I restriction endonuclease subunit R [Leptolyngbya sp. CCNP1308]|uniref:type I restriction endonuclease subunit R n=1 Tax=Leptolyngbya sp. CCNP1308 TaxID=3110255 RepID=UPI002B1F5616|nr:type I restriction endonuclease subunit R [Leptolyngbya sp. CCNP1308]MEA5448152.1 type I restriction endonuclease subunit R [Leptolyngbya sp. CCNP1308]